jgi:hypothetical protein
MTFFAKSRCAYQEGVTRSAASADHAAGIGQHQAESFDAYLDRLEGCSVTTDSPVHGSFAGRALVVRAASFATAINPVRPNPGETHNQFKGRLKDMAQASQRPIIFGQYAHDAMLIEMTKLNGMGDRSTPFMPGSAKQSREDFEREIEAVLYASHRSVLFAIYRGEQFHMLRPTISGTGVAADPYQVEGTLAQLFCDIGYLAAALNQFCFARFADSLFLFTATGQVSLFDGSHPGAMRFEHMGLTIYLN